MHNLPNVHDQKALDKLIAKYPKLLKNVELGCDIPQGWIPLVDRLCNSIMYTHEIESKRLPKVGQIKSKFGGLRFYLDSYYIHQSIKSVINFAESLSNIICEACGSMSARKTKTGWVMTLCRTCYPGEDLNDAIVSQIDPPAAEKTLIEYLEIIANENK